MPQHPVADDSLRLPDCGGDESGEGEGKANPIPRAQVQMAGDLGGGGGMVELTN